MDKNITAQNPAISVLMPAYNAERYIADTIKSVLAQTFRDFELVIVDDGSTDTTAEIVARFTDSRIRYIKNEKNTGLSAVRNKTLQESRAAYIALLDADDIALPTRLALQKEYLDTHPNIGLVGSAVDLIDEYGKLTGVRWSSDLPAEEIPVALMFHNQFAQSSVMARKTTFPTEGYREGFAPAEDYDLWTRITERQKVWNMPQVLVRYRVHAGGTSQQKHAVQIEATKNIRARLIAELGLNPTQEELALHRKRLSDSKEDIRAFLNAKERWLERLSSGNDAKKRYLDEIFKRGIAREWLETCYANTYQGLSVWKTFWSSKLSGTPFKGRTKKLTKFFIKSLFRLR